jgi:hypothetical protein
MALALSSLPEVLQQRTVADLRRELDAACRSGSDEKFDLWRAYRRGVLLSRARVRAHDDDVPMWPTLREKCRRSLGFFSRTYCDIYEPKRAAAGGATDIPFVPYPHQEWASSLLLELLSVGGTLAINKGRQYGLTWGLLIPIIWLWLYRDGMKLGVGSRTEDNVDKNPGSQNKDSLFGRMEYVVEGLPEFLRPRGYRLADDNQRQMLQWINPENGNTITGEAAGPMFSQSRTYGLMLIDEMAKWKFQESVLSGTQPNCWARILLSAPDVDAPATKEAFEQVRKATPRFYLDLPWTVHPERTRQWAEGERTALGQPQLFEQLHNLSWESGSERRIYPEFDQVSLGIYPYRPDWPCYGGIDFGRTNNTALVWAQQNPVTGRWRLLASTMRAGQPIEFFLPFFGKPRQAIHQYTEDEERLIDLARQWSAGGVAWFGDPAGQQASQLSNTSVVGTLQQYGVAITTNPRMRSHDERQTRTKILLRGAECHQPLCALLIRAMKAYRRPTVRANSTTVTKKPVHDWSSDLATALEYLSVNVDGMNTRETAPPPARQQSAWEVA